MRDIQMLQNDAVSEIFVNCTNLTALEYVSPLHPLFRVRLTSAKFESDPASIGCLHNGDIAVETIASHQIIEMLDYR